MRLRHRETHEERDERWRVEQLGRYNAERARGLVHTLEWQAFMSREQRWFDALQETRRVEEMARGKSQYP